MKTGIITFYHPAKLYGFIQDEIGVDFFFHHSNVAEGFTPVVAIRVEFETAPPIKIGKREQAVKVRPVGGAR